MSLIFSPNFQFTFSEFDKVTYVTGSYRLTFQRTECKHLLKDLAFNSLQDRICLQNSLGGSKPIFSLPFISFELKVSVESVKIIFKLAIWNIC